MVANCYRPAAHLPQTIQRQVTTLMLINTIKVAQGFMPMTWDLFVSQRQRMVHTPRFRINHAAHSHIPTATRARTYNDARANTEIPVAQSAGRRHQSRRHGRSPPLPTWSLAVLCLACIACPSAAQVANHDTNSPVETFIVSPLMTTDVTFHTALATAVAMATTLTAILIAAIFACRSSRSTTPTLARSDSATSLAHQQQQYTGNGTEMHPSQDTRRLYLQMDGVYTVCSVEQAPRNSSTWARARFPGAANLTWVDKHRLAPYHHGMAGRSAASFIPDGATLLVNTQVTNTTSTAMFYGRRSPTLPPHSYVVGHGAWAIAMVVLLLFTDGAHATGATTDTHLHTPTFPYSAAVSAPNATSLPIHIQGQDAMQCPQSNSTTYTLTVATNPANVLALTQLTFLHPTIIPTTFFPPNVEKYVTSVHTTLHLPNTFTTANIAPAVAASSDAISITAASTATSSPVPTTQSRTPIPKPSPTTSTVTVPINISSPTLLHTCPTSATPKIDFQHLQSPASRPAATGHMHGTITATSFTHTPNNMFHGTSLPTVNHPTYNHTTPTNVDSWLPSRHTATHLTAIASVAARWGGVESTAWMAMASAIATLTTNSSNHSMGHLETLLWTTAVTATVVNPKDTRATMPITALVAATAFSLTTCVFITAAYALLMSTSKGLDRLGGQLAQALH